MKHYGDIAEVSNLTAVSGSFSLSHSIQGFPTAPSVGPNLLANPTFNISIRGNTINSSNTFFPNNDDSYGLDTWNILSNGNNIANYIRATTPGGGLATGMRMTVVTANQKFGAVCFLGFQQSVLLRSQNVALQLAAFNEGGSSLGTLRAAILEWTGTADVLTSDVVSSWNAAGTDPTLVSNWAYVGSPVALSLTSSVQILKLEGGYTPGNSTNNLAVFFWSDDTTTTAAESIVVGNAQFEQSRFCTRFHYPGDTEVRTRCQYLANTSFLDQITPVAGDGSFNGAFKITGPVAGTQSFNASIQLPVRMRLVPTVSTYNPRSGATAAGNRNLWSNNSIDFVSTRVIQSSEQMITVDNSGVLVSGTTAAFIAGYWFATADY